MKKLAFAFVLMGLFGLAISGCRAGAEIDPDARGNVVVPQ